jgi:hypothetical protein
MARHYPWRAFFSTLPFPTDVKLYAANAPELAILDQCPPELGHSGKDAEQQAPVRRGGVDLALVHSDAHTMGYCNWPTPRARHVRFGSKADI